MLEICEIVVVVFSVLACTIILGEVVVVRVNDTPEFIFLNNDLLKPALLIRFLEQSLLDRTLRRETVNDDGARLPDTVGAVLRLQVLLRVPVAVIKDDGIGSGEIDAEPAGAGAEQEKLAVGVRVEGFDLVLAVGGFDGAVDAADGPSVQDLGPVLEEVELGLELGEEDDFVVFGEEGGDEAVEHDHFP